MQGLTGCTWDLISIVHNGTEVEGVERACANILLEEGNKAYGHGGCNRFFGSYTLDDEHLRVGPLASTRMYCKETMEVETAFFRALERVSRVSVLGGSMRMWSEDGSSALLFLKGTIMEKHQ